MPVRVAVALSICFAALAFVMFGCAVKSREPARDIAQTLKAHQEALMSIPGVVGVYTGLMQDEKTECIKVMLAAPDAAAQRKIPKKLDGFPVVTEITGEIKPL